MLQNSRPASSRIPLSLSVTARRKPAEDRSLRNSATMHCTAQSVLQTEVAMRAALRCSNRQAIGSLSLRLQTATAAAPRPQHTRLRAVAYTQFQPLHSSPTDVPSELVKLALQQQQQQLADMPSLAAAQQLYETAEGLETPIQLIYLTALLGFLAFGAYLVVRQVLIRRELDEAAKALGERIRTGEATCEDYYELGVILTRKKLYTQATKNLEKAKKLWDGEESDLAQVHNALGFCYFSMEKVDLAIQEYRKAVELQQGYVTAWNNLGDAYERGKDWKNALASYSEALAYAPSNNIARQRADYCKNRVEGLGL